MKTILKQTLLYYRLFIALTIVFGIFAAFLNPISIEGELSVSLESLMILINLATIPFSMKYSAIRLKKINEIINTKDKFEEYRKLYFLRITILSLVLIFNFILFSLLQKSSCLIFSGLIYIISMFCYPSKNRIENELELEQDQDI